MMRRQWLLALLIPAALCTTEAVGEEYHLIIGVDAGLWPGEERDVAPVPGPCCESTLYDGDRLAGNLPAGPTVVFQGSGTPMYDPNEFGSLSFTFRRGSVPFFNNLYPLQGVDFLGGPLLDLDGDLENGARSLVPVSGETAVAIPDSSSFIDLLIDIAGGEVTLVNFDATGTNEGGPGISAQTATTLTLLAGMSTNGVPGDPINEEVDTRVGVLTAFTGASTTLTGVYRIEEFGFEFWQDTLLSTSASADTLGTFQFLGAFRGWLVKRDPQTRQFPSLTGEGLGSALWPMVDTSGIGQTFNTANGLAGGSATIRSGITTGSPPNQTEDDFTAPGNGGTGPTALGSYLDDVVVPQVDALSDSFVYLEAAGFGINNSGDPIFNDTASYDLLVIAQQAPVVDGDYDGDDDADLHDFADFQACFSGGEVMPAGVGCEVFDFDLDNHVDLADYEEFAGKLTGPE